MIDMAIIFPLIAAFQGPTQSTHEPRNSGPEMPPEVPLEPEALAHFSLMMRRGIAGGDVPNDEAGRASLLIGIPMDQEARHAFMASRSAGAPWSQALFDAGLTRHPYTPQRLLERDMKAFFMAPPRVYTALRAQQYPYAFTVDVNREDGPLVVDFRGANWLTSEFLSSTAIKEFLYGIGLTAEDAELASKVAIQQANGGYEAWRYPSLAEAMPTAWRLGPALQHMKPRDPLLVAPSFAPFASVRRLFDYGLFPPSFFGWFGPQPTTAAGNALTLNGWWTR